MSNTKYPRVYADSPEDYSWLLERILEDRAESAPEPEETDDE
jgi:hypothetical protein